MSFYSEKGLFGHIFIKNNPLTEMIKEIINQLTNDKIPLSQALNRAKVLAFKINNDILKNWLRNELEGYDDEDENIPKYRKLNCTFYLTHKLPTGQKDDRLIAAKDSEANEVLNYFTYSGSIPSLEKQLQSITDETVIASISTESAISLVPEDRFNSWVIGGYRKMTRGQFIGIIEVTKQKLLDTLLELDSIFPRIVDDFILPPIFDNVQTVINNNINGNNNAVTTAAGERVSQSHISSNITNTESFSELEKLGVDKVAVEDLQQIILNNIHDKSSLKEKALKWFGEVSAKVATKGLTENLPAIFEFLHQHIS